MNIKNLFGFKIGKTDEKVVNMPSFVPPNNEDGALTIAATAHFGSAAIDMDGSAKNEVELITKYREMSMQPEIESAIDDIVNEAIVHDDSGKSVEIIMDNLNESTKIKRAIEDEFKNVLRLLNFANMGSDIFRRFYIDGRLFYHVIIDVDNPHEGIKELRYIDPRKIRKIREIQKEKSVATGTELITQANEYYLYSERAYTGPMTSTAGQGLRISTDSILSINSGLMDARKGLVLSYLHKCIKPLNMLRMIEDATVIYRLTRSSEKRVFYIDTGNLPKIKADAYVKDVMTKYRNKMIYNTSTGQIQSEYRHMAMIEDFWFPKKSDGTGSQVTTLPAGANLGDMADVEYFEKKLYKSLNVPVSRLNPAQAVSIGRSTEITRDELKFSKFIDKIRGKFTELFDQVLRIQLSLKGICTEEEWGIFKEDIYYDFLKDNNFVELKNVELMQERLGVLSMIDQYAGKYYSKQWIKQNIMHLNELEIDEMNEQIEQERQEDFQVQAELQKNQIFLQKQQMDLQQQLMPDQEQPIDAGEAPEGVDVTNPYAIKQENPYNIQR